jgi:hypothetical protein
VPQAGKSLESMAIMVRIGNCGVVIRKSFFFGAKGKCRVERSGNGRVGPCGGRLDLICPALPPCPALRAEGLIVSIEAATNIKVLRGRWLALLRKLERLNGQ